MKTLSDNWVEDRLQPEGSLTVTGGLNKRTSRPHETDLAYIGERFDVLSRISRLPQRVSYAMPDDGFRETLSTNLHDLRHPKTWPSSYPKRQYSAPALINTANAPVCPPERRELDGPECGFGASLKKHQKNHEQRFWNTTHGDVFGEGSRKKMNRLCPASKSFAGFSTEAESTRVSGMQCGVLCGEQYRELEDPAKDTKTQRAWIPGRDPALRNVHMGGSRALLPPSDNALSLPLGDGAMARVRQDLKDRQGRLSRVATHITRGAHLKAGYAIFQDDD